MKTGKGSLCTALAVLLILFIPFISAAAERSEPPLNINRGWQYFIYSSSANPYPGGLHTGDGVHYGNCTWYAFGRAWEVLGSRPNGLAGLGNAGGWYEKVTAYSKGSTPKPIAIACWKKNGTTTYEGHVAFVEEVYSSTSIVISESNWHYPYPQEKYWRSKPINPYNYSSNLTFLGYIYLADVSGDNTAPGITSAKIGAVSPAGFNVNVTAADNTYLKAIQIGVWHSGMSIDDAVWQTKHAQNGENVEFFVDLTLFGNRKNVTYYVNVFAWDFAKNVSDGVRAGNLYLEGEPPTVTGAEIINVTPMGYDVVCTATDNTKIAFFRIGTWHDSMNIDNAVWQNVPSDGSRTVIHISVSDFAYAQGVTYHTNVYACDASGNYSEAVSAGSCHITQDLSELVQIRNVSVYGYDLVCSAASCPGAARLRIGTWHDNMNIDNAVWQEINAVNGVFRVNTADFGNAVNVVYHTNLFITDTAGQVGEAVRIADILIENTPPVVTGSAVSNITIDGYDVICCAEDNSKVSRIRIGTWHDEMSIDDAVWQEAEYSGEPAVIHVDVKDFAGKRDVIYHTNVFAIDRCENVSAAVRAGDPFVSRMPDLADYDVLYLPNGLVTIETEALAGTEGQIVVIPQSCRRICANAFAGSIRLEYIILPTGAEIEIDPDAFTGINARVIREH